MSEQIINSFNKGMHSGIDPSVFPEGSYRTMRNGHIFARNDRGFVVTNITKPSAAFSLTEGYVPIGSCEFNGKLYIMSYNGSSTSMVEFGVYTPGAVTPYSPLATLTDAEGSGRPLRIDASLIGYSKEHLVSMFPRLSYDGSVNLYICDGLNANIVVNTKQTYYDISSNALESSDFAHFKSIESLPTVSGKVVNGGNLKPGNYFLAFRYTTQDYNSTIFFNQIGPFVISESDRGTLDINDATLPRSIELELSDMDADYRYVEVAVIRYFGETEAMSFDMYLMAKKFTKDADKIIIYGDEDQMAITPEEILKNNIIASSCKTHLQHNNRYYGANWKAEMTDLHDALSKAAGHIIPRYAIKDGSDNEQAAFARNYSNMNAYKEMKYKAGEVYPFAVSFVISGKYISEAYPVCGYDSNVSDFEAVYGAVNQSGGYLSFANNKGLYRFPYARKGIDSSGVLGKRYFYGMMGVKFDLSLANSILEGVDVTAVLIMQGKRVANCESQGLVLPMISRLALRNKDWYSKSADGVNWIASSLIIALGDGERKTMFPWYYYNTPNALSDEESAEAYKRYSFPIIFVRGSSNPQTPIMNYNQWGYVGPYVRTKNFDSRDLYEDGDTFKEVHPGDNQTIYIDFNFPLEKVAHYHWNVGPKPDYIPDNITFDDEQTSRNFCSDFAYFSPDLANNRSIFSGIVRTVHRIVYNENIKRGAKKGAPPITQCILPYNNDGIHFRKLQRAFDYMIDTEQILGGEYQVFGNDHYHSFLVDMTHVDSERILPDDNGCISRMKSPYEVFGPLNTTDDDDSNYFITNIAGRTRRELMQSGIVLNRIMFQNEAQTSEAEINMYTGNDVIYQHHMWQGYIRQIAKTTKNTLPLIMLNMSMASKPYEYFQVHGLTNSNFLPDYICERYKYDPDATGDNSPYLKLLASFLPNNERYCPICLKREVDGVTEEIYKGDVFAQVVEFRFNRWTHEPLHNPYDKDYRHGQMAKVYLESFVNHRLRVSDDNKTFMPYASKFGLTQEGFAYSSNIDVAKAESWSYNAGHMELRGMFSRYGIDINDPMATTDKPNRVYWSSIYTDGSFEDAYRDIAVGNYKDFNPENGIIQKIVKHSDRLFIIQERGISQLYEANSLEQSEDSSSIIIGDPGVLYPQTHELSTYGTQHPESIVTGANGVYGVDWMQKKIWSIQLKISDRGNYFHLVEDLLESKSLRTFFKDLEGANYKPMNTLANTLFASTPIGIASGADQELGKIYFTFHISGKIETLVYDENQQVFLGCYDYSPNIYLPFRNKCLMFKSGSVKVLQPEGATTYNNSTAAEEALGPFTLEFYVNGISGQRNLSNLQKEYILHRIFGSDNLLKLDAYTKDIEWSTEYQDSKFSSTVDKDDFWRTPYFEDHVWNVPISVAEQTEGADGPNGGTAYESFEEGSTMRGEWLKVKLTYRGNEEIYIKNIVTDILNSFS